jgi:uncharacterized protein (TIGR02466 family)
MADTRFDPIAEAARNGQVEYMFATPVFRDVLANADALNAELADLILERERTTPSLAKSNQGGWQSAPDFFSWAGPAVAMLERYVAGALNVATARLAVPSHLGIEFELYGWAAVNRRGHYNTTHVHPMATWSGTYYVDVGDEPADAPGAVLEFSHPVTAAAMTFFPGVLPSARIVRPESGMVILFPSYLQHSVRM